MNDLLAQISALNQQLETLLVEADVDWVQCLELVERRDNMLEQYLSDADQNETRSDKSELKSVMEKSLELNKRIAARMKAEQDDAEQALLKVNQGKKARASYE